MEKCKCLDSARCYLVSDLLARAEAAEAAQETLQKAMAEYKARAEKVEKVWSPCNFCAGAKYITGTVTAVYPVSETHQQETLAEGDFDFCPECGRPLTDEAVDMVMERLKALYETAE